MSKYINSDPNILSGMPVIMGTRVPVARILSLLKEGYTLAAIHKQFDHILMVRSFSGRFWKFSTELVIQVGRKVQ